MLKSMGPNLETMMEDQLAAEHRGSLVDTRCHASQIPDGGLVSFINGLPVELLEEIFWHFVRDLNRPPTKKEGPANANTYQIQPYRKPSGDPIILGTICKLWRTIALSVPGLWSTIHLTTHHSHPSERLQLYLDRCGSEPLALSLLVFQPPRRYNPGYSQRVRCLERYASLCESVLSLVPRCKRLYLDLHWELQHTDALSHIYATPPLILEEFSANFSGGWDTRKVTKFCAYLHASPALQRVRWHGLHGANSLGTHKLVQSINPVSIRDLELCDFHQFDEMVDFLRKCQNLETLACHAAKPPQASMALILYGTSAIPTPPPFTVLGRLRTLSLLSVSALDHVFNLLVLPSLQKLTIDHCWDMESAGSPFADIGWDALRQMLERSQCQLQSLEYKRHGEYEEAPTVSESALVRFLESPCTRWLEHLAISAAVGDETLRALTLVSGRPPACPSLKRVVIGRCGSTDGVWSDMVLSRTRDAARLESTSVGLRGQSESNFTRDLMLVVPGVNVEAEWME